MEKITYNGVDGIFIPMNEYEYIKESINNCNLLLKGLINENIEKNQNTFDYLLNLK